MSIITIRPLVPSQWPEFKAFRLAALKAQPGVFFRSHAEESAYTPEQWQNIMQGPAHQVFGLFDNKTLIGITNASAFLEEDPSGATAILGMSYILPEYRGRGLSKMLYQTRLDWIRSKPQFTRVLTHHRASNIISGEANKHHGFKPIGRQMQTWPDGVSEEEIIYELKL